MFTSSLTGILAGAVLALLLAAACVTDLRERRIPNELVIVLALAGLAYSVWALGPAAGAARAFLGIAVGLLFWLPWHLLKMMGAGDVKFFAAAAAWLGPVAAIEASLFSALLGGVLALVWLAMYRGAPATAPVAGGAAPGPEAPRARAVDGDGKRVRLPYGVAMAAGIAASAWLPGVTGILGGAR
ncbi:MAG TPA: prepilin peptidase [Gemmatimonadaceae bacterium]|nr:prepilin peptidase [Gemmatimonadaceae bacterium]